MNIYLNFIICFLILEFLLNTISKYLNLHSLLLKVPEQFIDYYNEEKYKSSQQYNIDKIKFNFITSSINLFFTIIFIIMGGFNYIDTKLRESFIDNDIILGVLFIVTLILINLIISLPFSYYSTFYIEQKYGFNKSTKTLFFIDTIKGFIITIILGSIILSFFIIIFSLFRNFAWIYSWILMTIFIIFTPIIYINWIAPLFNNFEKLEDGELKKKINNYSKKVNFPLKEIFIMDGSKRSSHSNAYFTGFGKNKRIVLFDTLLDNHSNDEIIAIIAHEVGHYKKKHILFSTLISIIFIGIMLYSFSFFIRNSILFEAFKMENISIYAGIIIFSILYSPISLILGIIMNYYSRYNEYEADQFSSKTIQDKNELIKALKNLSVSNLSNLAPHPFHVILNFSHPPVLKRIEKIKSY